MKRTDSRSSIDSDRRSEIDGTEKPEKTSVSDCIGKKFRISFKDTGEKCKKIRTDWMNSIQVTHTLLNQVSVELKQIRDQLDSIIEELDALDKEVSEMDGALSLREGRESLNAACKISDKANEQFKNRLQPKIKNASDKISSLDADFLNKLSKQGCEKLKETSKALKRLSQLIEDNQLGKNDVEDAGESVAEDGALKKKELPKFTERRESISASEFKKNLHRLNYEQYKNFAQENKYELKNILKKFFEEFDRLLHEGDCDSNKLLQFARRISGLVVGVSEKYHSLSSLGGENKKEKQLLKLNCASIEIYLKKMIDACHELDDPIHEKLEHILKDQLNLLNESVNLSQVNQDS